MSIRSDIIRTGNVVGKRAADKKKIKTAGMLGDLWDYATGKKKTRKEKEEDSIDDILKQDPDYVPPTEPTTPGTRG